MITSCNYLSPKIITMAIQHGLVKLTGPVGGYSGYYSDGKYIMRAKGGASKEHINTAPSCARTRENNAELKHTSRMSLRLRNSLFNVLPKVKFNKLHNRLTDTFFDMLYSDTTSDRGARKVYKGNFDLLKGFNINKFLPLEHTYFGKLQHQFSEAKDMVKVTMEFNPITDVKAPKSTTHLEIKTILSIVPIEDDKVGFSLSSDAVVVPHDNIYVEPDLSISIPIAAEGCMLLHLIQIKYLQELNGSFYDINEKGGKVLTVLEGKIFN